MRNEQNNTRHTEILKSSLRCSKPNTALQSSLRQRSNHCKTPNHAVPKQGAAPRHTQSLDPNRRPYTTERLHFTQDHTATQSFQLVFRVQSHDARRCVNSNSNRKTARQFTNLKTQNASHTERMHTNCSSIPQLTFEITFRQIPVRSPVKSPRFLTAISLPFTTLTRRRPTTGPKQVVAAYWLRNQLLYASPVGPVDTIVTRYAVPCEVRRSYARPAVCRSRQLAV